MVMKVLLTCYEFDAHAFVQGTAETKLKTSSYCDILKLKNDMVYTHELGDGKNRVLT